MFNFAGALPLPFIAEAFLVFASQNKQNASLSTRQKYVYHSRKEAYPPMPQQLGSVTLSAADVATAASATKRAVRSWANFDRIT